MSDTQAISHIAALPLSSDHGSFGPCVQRQVSGAALIGGLIYHRDEFALAGAARLALADGHTSIEAFLADRAPALRPSDLWAGRGQVELARFFGAPENVFASPTPILTPERHWRLNGQTIRLRGIVDRRCVRICLECQREQAHLAAHAPEAGVSPHLSGLGTVRLVRACARHGCMLHELPYDRCDIASWADGGSQYGLPTPCTPASDAEIHMSKWVGGRLGFSARCQEPPEFAALSLNLAIPLYARLGRATSDTPLDPIEALKAGLFSVAGRPLREALDELGRRASVGHLPSFSEAYGNLAEVAGMSLSEPALRPFAERLVTSALGFTSVNPSNFRWLTCCNSGMTTCYEDGQGHLPLELSHDPDVVIGTKGAAYELGCDLALAAQVIPRLDGSRNGRFKNGRLVPIGKRQAMENFRGAHALDRELALQFRMDRTQVVELLAAGGIGGIGVPVTSRKWRSPNAGTFYPRDAAEAILEIG